MGINRARPMLTINLGARFIDLIHRNYRFHIFPLLCRKGNQCASSQIRFEILVAYGIANLSPLAIETS
jgi:hypothetical protein